ncbi:MAG: hypothetical protein ACXVEE_06635 [Polyangiales bacterium]
MGAHAYVDQPKEVRAKSLGLTLLRPTTRASLTPPSLLSPLPHEVLVLDEGIAVATYEDDGSVQYGSLGDLLRDHGLDESDLEVVERVRGVGRWG